MAAFRMITDELTKLLDSKKEIARLEWERRYLLNRATVKKLIAGSYGVKNTFSDEILEIDVASAEEARLRHEYQELGGDVSEWWVHEFGEWLKPYGWFCEKVADGVWEINEYEYIAPEDSGGVNTQVIIARIEKQDAFNFLLRCSLDPNKDPVTLPFDENWSEVRVKLFRWCKENESKSN